MMAPNHFDKILLTSILIFFSLLAFHGYHYKEQELAMMCADQAKYFAGALLTLITGRALANLNGKNGNGATPAPATNPTNPQAEEKKELH